MRLFITLLLSLHIFIVLAWQRSEPYLDNDQYVAEYSKPRQLQDILRGLLAKRGSQEQENPIRRIEYPTHIVNITEDCIKVSVQTGHFYFRASTASQRVCGLYLLSEPDYKIEITITYMDAPCANNSIIEVVDGWELSGQYFPSSRDHVKKNLSERITDSCGSTSVKKIFISSQNAALIEYRLTQRGHSFAVIVNHILNPKPCNILVYGGEGEYKLRNFGKRINCSLTSVEPSTFRMIGVDVGNTPWPLSRAYRTIFYSEYCIKRGMADYVEIGGSNGLDNTVLNTADTVCGLGSDNINYTISCDVSTVRLVSSGFFRNEVIVDIKALPVDLPFAPSVLCSI